MKTLIYFLPLSILLLAFTSYNNQFKKNYAKIEYQGKTLYVGKYEVSNGDYYQFLDAIKTDPKKLTVAQVYSQNWDLHRKLIYGEPYVEYYFSHPAYNNYPVVNVSYEGAQAYCQWLSTEITKETGKKVNARLPSKDEWLYASSDGNQALYGWGKNEWYSEKEKACYGNFKSDKSTLPENAITAPVDAYIPNKFGLYNCSGNVSEMLEEKGLCAGGSWETPVDSIALATSIIPYTNISEITRGFRVVLEIED